MKRRVIATIVVLFAGVVMAWVMSNTEWTDVTVASRPMGEARTDPFYASERLVEALDARAIREHVFTQPPADAVIFLSSWNWSIADARRVALERWVESGGRLVVDASLDEDGGFQRWSGLSRKLRTRRPAPGEGKGTEDRESCPHLREEPQGSFASGPAARHRACNVISGFTIESRNPTIWTLRDDAAVHAARVAIGRGSVTLINAVPFRWRDLFDGDHAWMFVAATQLRPGDEVHFLTDDNRPSLLALMWRTGAPVIVLACLALAGAIWRGSFRFGPLAAPPEQARRSLAEQIRGSGQFALHHGGEDALHEAGVRALDAAAARRIPRYASLTGADRGAALSRATGFDREALLEALYHPRCRQPDRLRDTLALVETARRRLLNLSHSRTPHGQD